MLKNKEKKPAKTYKPTLSHADQDMIDELDYEEKKKHMPYDPYKRTWDEA